MPRLLLNLRNVPDDEADDVRSFLDANSIDWYQTRPSVFGISAGGIWLPHPDDFERARKLMTEYQTARQTRVRAELEQARRDGTAPTLLGEWRANPRNAVLTLIALALAVAVAAWPLWLLR